MIFGRRRPSAKDFEEARRVLAMIANGLETGLEDLSRSARDCVEPCLVEMLAAVRGSARDRLTRFAVDHDIARRWVKGSEIGETEERVEAIRRLGLLSAEAMLDPLLSRATDEEILVRVAAVTTLLDSGAVKSLHDLLADFEPVTRRSLLHDLRESAEPPIAARAEELLLLDAPEIGGSRLGTE